MKKTALFLLVSALVFALSACSFVLLPQEDQGGNHSSPYPAEKDCSAGLAYQLNANGKGYTVTGIGECLDADLVIPATHNGDTVTAIADRAFYDLDQIETLTIPTSVTYIGEGAFYMCYHLINVTIPATVTYMGGLAFAETSITSFSIPAGISSLEDGTFRNCDSLSDITVPSSVCYLRDNVFSSCNALLSVRLPSTLLGIGDDVFEGCAGLSSLQFDGTTDAWLAISKTTVPPMPVICTDGTVMPDGTVQ